MSSEKYVCLVKDFGVAIPGDWIHIFGKNINSIGRELSPYPASHLIRVLTANIEELKNKHDGREWRIMSLCSDQRGQEIYFKTYLDKGILEHICRNLPKSFIKILYKIKLEGNGNQKEFEKRFEFADIMKATNTENRRPLFSTGNSIDKNCTCDIFIGWTNVKKLQLNSTSLVQNMFERDATKDLVIVAGNGAEVKCHRFIFEAHSDVLAAMVSPKNGMQESATGRIELTENSEEGLSHLIRYLYGMELSTDVISCDVAVELFKTSEKYKLTELQKFIEEMFLTVGSDWFTPDDLLELYFHVRNLDDAKNLHEHVVALMITLSTAIRYCERFLELKLTDPEAAMTLVWMLFDLMVTREQALQEKRQSPTKQI